MKIDSDVDAQYGKNSDAQIKVITRSGGTQIHGRGYWYFHDCGLHVNNS